MPLILCFVFMVLSLLSFLEGSGIASGIFVILSAVAFINHTGGPKGPDDQRMA